MKDYEKAAIAIGAAALGLAAYQAHKTKEAVDATQATDPSRNPVQAAVDLSRNMIGSTTSWLRQRFDEATGFVKGKSENVIDDLKAIPSSPLYFMKPATDFGRDAVEAGSKYLWSGLATHAANSKEKIEQLTNKPFTQMGATVTGINLSRYIPTFTAPIGNALSGVGSKLEETTKTTKSYFVNIKDSLFGLLRR